MVMSRLYIDFASLGPADDKAVRAKSNLWFLVQSRRNALSSYHELGNPPLKSTRLCSWAQESSG